MKIAGIVVEYNPLHNGHLYHIEETKKRSGCDVLVAVMSGNFTQRGEPTIVDKFTRTKWALQHGIDLVIELPFVFGVQHADLFARYSIELLHHIGVTDVYFGSEEGDIKPLIEFGSVLRSDAYKDALAHYHKQGLSYPTASDKAMSDVLGRIGFDLPNNILGIQYILAGYDLNTNITFHTIKRLSTGYYDEVQANTSIQSATAIRRLAQANEDISPFVPSDVQTSLSTLKLVSYNDFTESLQGILHRSTAPELHAIAQVTEGLEHRIKKITTFQTIDELIKQIISRRYTNSKIKRMLAHILCNVKQSDEQWDHVPYVRVLGMTSSGRQHLNQIKKTIPVPLYTKIKEGIHPIIDIELRVSKVYNMACKIDVYKQEFSPVIF